MAWNGKRYCAWVPLLLILFNTVLGSQETSPAHSDSYPLPERPIRTEVQLVLVNVSVVDPYDRLVTGLGSENFQIYEDKKLQRVPHFSTEEVPISVGIIFDTSGSMAGKLDRARMALAYFLRTANLQDEFFLIDFGDRPRHVVDFTHDASVLQNKLLFSEAKGRTALLDSIYLGLHEMRKAQRFKLAVTGSAPPRHGWRRWSTGQSCAVSITRPDPAS